MDKNYSCDIETKVCTPNQAKGIETLDIQSTNKVRLVYYTDPICSACWAIEPQLKRFKLEYGHHVDIEYKMGGLLPGWEGFADAGNGISKPSDVAHHWEEVGEYSGMSIDGDVWLEDPLDSSFPPSIAFKAAQVQGEDFAIHYLRRLREYVFLYKKNITKESHLVKAIEDCGGDKDLFLKYYKDDQTKAQFYKDLEERASYGVRGFPSFIFVNKSGQGFKLSGMSPYEQYVQALQQALGERPVPRSMSYSMIDLLKKYPLLATKEMAVILGLDEKEVNTQLNQLVAQGSVLRKAHKHGDFWELSGR